MTRMELLQLIYRHLTELSDWINFLTHDLLDNCQWDGFLCTNVSIDNVHVREKILIIHVVPHVKLLAKSLCVPHLFLLA